MLKIRLTRRGSKGKPFYRVVVQDSRAPRNGKFVDWLGHYDPLPEQPIFKVDHERTRYWLGKGAQPTETVHRFLAKEGLIDPLVAKPRSKRSDLKRAAAAAAAE